MKTKTFDCVQMKRRGGRRVYERIKGLTTQQELAYWRHRTARLDRRIKTARTRRPRRRKPRESLRTVTMIDEAAIPGQHAGRAPRRD